MTIYHVRPMDLHAPGEHCNSYDCSAVVMRHEYDALAARLNAAERWRDYYRAKWFGGVAVRPPDVPSDSAPGSTID